jgi:hypothetical protein
MALSFRSFRLLSGLLACFLAGAEAQADAPQFNPNFHYFIGGKVIGPRTFVLGDPANWGIELIDLSGHTANKKVKVQPEDYRSKNDALHIVWSKAKMNGQIALYGTPINLSAVRDQVTLVFDVKVERKPTSDVTVAMDCEYPCRGTFNAANVLRKFPKGEWRYFSLPLTCIRGNNFDLSKINGVFLMATEGAMELSIANIRLERLSEGERGCVD